MITGLNAGEPAFSHTPCRPGRAVADRHYGSVPLRRIDEDPPGTAINTLGATYTLATNSLYGSAAQGRFGATLTGGVPCAGHRDG